MKTNKKQKKFDAVKMMREIRAKISSETEDLSYEELKKYINNKLQQSDKKPIGH